MPELHGLRGRAFDVALTDVREAISGQAGVVSVHDLTPLRHPELCDAATLAYPGLIRRALRRGAWVHADSAFVAG